MTAETEVDWSEVGGDASDFEGNTMPRTSRARASAGTRGRRVSDKRLTSLSEKLTQEMFQAGAMIGLGVPVTGYYICQESENFCNAVVQLAAKNSKWVTALENISMLGPGLIVGRTTLGIGAALAADRYYRTQGESGLDPDKRAAMFLGVSAAYYAVHNNNDGESPNGQGNYTPPPYGGFSPVS